MALRALRRPLSLLLALTSPVVIGALLVAKDAPAGPPGPWVWIPPPGSTTSPTATVAATSASGATTSSAGAKGPEGFDRTHHAIVVIERDKRPIALGVLLNERSVVLTARSPIAASTGGDLEIRYPDIGTVKAKMVHEDAAWDLALVVPQSTKGVAGANASASDPLAPAATFSTYVLLKTGKTQPQATPVLGKRDYLSPDGQTLKDALSLDPAKAIAIGGPLVDADGGVVALVTRACAPGGAPVAGAKSMCTPTLFGVPLAQVRSFLKSAPASARAPSAWLGAVGLTEPLGVRVVSVEPGSPAAAAGIKPGDPLTADVIVAVDGDLTRTADALSDKIRRHSPGDVVSLLLANAGHIREVKVTLKGTDDASATPPPPKPTATATPAPSIITLPLPPIPSIFKPR